MRKFATFLFLILLSSNAFAGVVFSEIDVQDCDTASSCTDTEHAGGGAGTITLVAQASDDSTATDRDTQGCTQGGVAMTRVSDNEVIGGNSELDVFYSIQGTPGDIVCTWGGAVTGGGMISVTYTGILITGNPNTVAENSASPNTVVQQTITPTVDNVMLVDFVTNTIGSTSYTPDNGQTERADSAIGGLTFASSEKQAAVGKAYTMGQTTLSSGGLAYKIVAIRPSVTSVNSLGVDSLGVTS